MKESQNKFEEIYNTESDSIFRFCLLRVSDREQALDITQESFLRLWQNFSERINNHRAFLFTIARNLIIDWYRKKKSISLDKMIEDEKSEDIPDIDTSKEDFLFRAEARNLLEKIKALEKTDQESVYLRYVEDLSPQEIGEILGISANAASARINRGLVELRKKVIDKK